MSVTQQTPSRPPSAPAPLDDATLTREDARDRASAVVLTAQDVHVDLTGVQAQDARTFAVETTLHLEVLQEGADLRIDFLGESVDAVEVVGPDGTRTALAPADVAGTARILVPDLTAGEQRVTVRGTARYSRSGEGLHRFVDPVDGNLYLYTHSEPADARRVFPTLEQPDLKTVFTFSLTGPADWILANNRPEASREEVGEGQVRVTFEPTLPQSGYITCLAAGPYATWEDTWGGHEATGATAVPLRVLARRSIAEHMDADVIMDTTKRGLTLFHDLFGVPYAWGKYDQVFVPEYNLGAMENPGLVTFTEDFVFTSPPTTLQREGRATVILHEMAHLWFGDLVTMRWWDDLWLKESFADFMGTLAVDEATDFTGSWVTFASRRKAWAYVQDQLPTTHPIVADIPDLEAARQNFDGITYAKGAAVLKQLAAFVGREAFLGAAQRYFRAHAWGTAELADFLAALEEASGRDMRAWADAWLRTSGVPRLAVELDDDGAARLIQSGTDPVTGYEVLRPQMVGVGVYCPDGQGVLRRTDHVRVDVPAGAAGRSVAVAALQVPQGVRLVLPNDEDLTYALLQLDGASLEAVLAHPVADPLAQATVWAALWAMTRAGELPAATFVDAVVRQAGAIVDAGVLSQVLVQAASAVGLYARAADRDRLRGELGDALAVLMDDPDQDRARAAARVLGVLVRRDPERAAAFAGRAEVQADVELHWLGLQALAATGQVERAALDAALEAERTTKTLLWHRVAVYARPAAGAKASAWEHIVSGRDEGGAELTNDALSATAEGFVAGDAALTAPYAERLWPELERIWADRSNGLASRTISGVFPLHQDAVDGDADAQQSHPVLAAADAWLTQHPQAPRALRRLVVEHTDALRRSLRVQAMQPRG